MKLCDLLVETTEEDQELIILARHVTQSVMSELQRKKGGVLSSLLSISLDFHTLDGFGRPIKNMRVPSFKNPAIQQLVDTHSIAIEDDDSSRGAYAYNANVVYVNTSILKTASDFQDTLVHEFRHALDNIKSSGKAFKAKPVDVNKSSTDEVRVAYYDDPREVNARLTQVLSAISENMYRTSTSNLSAVIDRLFKHHDLTGLPRFKGPAGQKRYNRLRSRVYQFFAAQLNSPKEVAPHSLLTRAKNYIMGRSSTGTV